ncbi:uncharacterized protein LOC129731743 [Wyeomyia smithii]|uniref:uncharacterized protein LOC129731743 n=1 Tax=Wyeomyia smithii TaxID=174621 RepID=UPI002467E076|nr:uncharacterized protein LOC129731743 [Wyeomyia smithii]
MRQRQACPQGLRGCAANPRRAAMICADFIKQNISRSDYLSRFLHAENSHSFNACTIKMMFGLDIGMPSWHEGASFFGSILVEMDIQPRKYLWTQLPSFVVCSVRTLLALLGAAYQGYLPIPKLIVELVRWHEAQWALAGVPGPATAEDAQLFTDNIGWEASLRQVKAPPAFLRRLTRCVYRGTS